MLGIFEVLKIHLLASYHSNAPGVVRIYDLILLIKGAPIPWMARWLEVVKVVVQYGRMPIAVR